MHHIVHPTFLLGGGLNLLPNFQKGEGLTGPQFLEGVVGKEGVDIFQGMGDGGGGGAVKGANFR